jgi:His-Xaa-Ser system protein HxsD
MKKGISYTINNDALILFIEKEFFEKSAIHAASYKFTDKCIIQIEPEGEKKIAITMALKKPVDEIFLEELANEFMNEALDQQIRLDLEKRYGNIRELIVRHAFKPLENLKEALKCNE